ncbi:MAG: ABC transporter substrate-binding protein [Clostridiales bacterium]|nr:ABC transporter substrate-binding protein [Clostridiales bacterium]
MKRALIPLLLLALTLALAVSGAAETVTFTDALGREVTLAVPVRRAVAFEGSLAEAYLTCGGTLVGATEDAVTERGLSLGGEVSVIGTVKQPSLELTVALEPELILLSADSAAHLKLLDALTALGVPCAYFSFDTWQEYMDMADVLCRLTGHEELLEVQREQVQRPIEAIVSRAREDARYGQRTALLLRAYSTGVKAKGSDSLAGAMLAEMGLVNIADRDGALLESLTLEQILMDDPEWIFITTMGESRERAMDALAEALTNNPAWGALTAVREGRVVELDKQLFHYKPNARWAQAYALLEDLLDAP